MYKWINLEGISSVLIFNWDILWSLINKNNEWLSVKKFVDMQLANKGNDT